MLSQRVRCEVRAQAGQALSVSMVQCSYRAQQEAERAATRLCSLGNGKETPTESTLAHMPFNKTLRSEIFRKVSEASKTLARACRTGSKAISGSNPSPLVSPYHLLGSLQDDWSFKHTSATKSEARQTSSSKDKPVTFNAHGLDEVTTSQ